MDLLTAEDKALVINPPSVLKSHRENFSQEKKDDDDTVFERVSQGSKQITRTIRKEFKDYNALFFVVVLIIVLFFLYCLKKTLNVKIVLFTILNALFIIFSVFFGSKMDNTIVFTILNIVVSFVVVGTSFVILEIRYGIISRIKNAINTIFTKPIDVTESPIAPTPLPTPSIPPPNV